MSDSHDPAAERLLTDSDHQQRIGSEFSASSWIVVGVAFLLSLVVLGGVVWFVVWGWRG